MSFGFGSQNNNSTGFGAANNNNKFGFGNTSSGFGSSNTNTTSGFGSGSGTTTGSGLFGNNNNNTTQQPSSGFGGFGSGNAFGSSGTNTGGSLFGGSNNNNTSTPAPAFGGFGANNNATPAFGANTTNTTTGFGSSNTGTSLFGGAQNKPAFGGSTGGLFGNTSNTSNTSTGFGANNSNTSSGAGFGGFGANTSTFGQQATPQNSGTAGTPFEPFSEKDATSAGNNIYQSITCQPPYQKFSQEELRVADYNAGRRYGNANGQAGAFGQSTPFGNFGQSTNNTSTGFGSNNNTATTATTTGGGLFGGQSNSNTFGATNTNNNPTGFGSSTGTGGGIFGNTNTNNTGGGLFGNTVNNNNNQSGGLLASGNTNTGFGSSTNTGGGLFGTQNNQEQNKPFAGFGSTNTAAPAFGANNTSNPFGQNSNTGGTSLFGNNNNTAGTTGNTAAPATGGLFGNIGQNTQNNAQPAASGGSLFGGFGQNQQAQNQAKPGGLFGGTGTTGGGLFGNSTQQSQPTGGLFGNQNNATQASGAGQSSLFGSAHAPQAGGGLFGQTNTNTQSTGLFGQQNNQTQNKPSLFGNNTTNTMGGSLFGNTLSQNNTNQNAFGTSQQAQPLGGSLFGGSQQQTMPQNQQSMVASLAQNPYGNDQLFANLGAASPSVGPLATPLSGAQRPTKRSSVLPAFKINPSASMRLITPQRQSNYGLNYSTYGTPGSAQSFSTSRGNSLLASGGLGRPLSKSLSTSNLKTSLSTEDSVLAPGAFTPTQRLYSSGNSIRKLKIDRSLRTDLFGESADGERQQKRVSFDAHSTSDKSNGNVNGQTNGHSNSDTSDQELVRREQELEPSSEELGLLRAQRSSSKQTGSTRNNGRPEMEQTSGKELAIVPEDEQAPATEPRAAVRKSASKPQTDQEPGEYYTKPSLREIRDLSRDQLKNMSPFIVGRVGIGEIEFSKVDLNTIALDEIMGGIVKLNVRSATVYESGVNTPPEGKGLNVPSRITLENSWPRSNGGRLTVHERTGPRYDKHIERLKRVGGTEFLGYDAESGEWTFSVQHFTTYGLDDDEDEDEPMTGHGDGVIHNDHPNLARDETDGSAGDDTFGAQKTTHRGVPGGFEDMDYSHDDREMHAPVGHAAQSPNTPQRAQANVEGLEDPFRASYGADRAVAEVPAISDDQSEDDQSVDFEPQAHGLQSILKPAIVHATPPKQTLDISADWAAQLQRTVSPRKHDRQALREQQANAFAQDTAEGSKSQKPAGTDAPFNTTLDIMASLWAQPASIGSERGFEWPYQKRTKPGENMSEVDEMTQAFHASVKPRWAGDGTLVYGIAGNATGLVDGVMINCKKSIVSEGKDIRFAAFTPSPTGVSALLKYHFDESKISTNGASVPLMHVARPLSFAKLAGQVTGTDEGDVYERNVWRLASILFDPLHISCSPFMSGVPEAERPDLEPRIRREAVLSLWREMTSAEAAADARSQNHLEDKALAHLSAGDVEGACMSLVEGRNFHLATIIAQLPIAELDKQAIKSQIKAWEKQNTVSEMSQSIRALYAIAAGEHCTVAGNNGPIEDRASSFKIAEYCGLDWRRSLGLRLFYGPPDLAEAVIRYTEDLDARSEEVIPYPMGSNTQAHRNESDSETERVDILLGLLQLYAYMSKAKPDEVRHMLVKMLAPQMADKVPFDAWFAWQAATMLRANAVLDTEIMPDAIIDNLTLLVAFQLESGHHLVDACCMLLHLSTAAAREHHVKDLLLRRAKEIEQESSSEEKGHVTSNLLTERYKIPNSWVWTAQAMHAASIGDETSQAVYLLQAGEADEAHAVVCRALGPGAIISMEYDSLREILGTFIERGSLPGSHAKGTSRKSGHASSQNNLPKDWNIGGGVYSDYVHLLDLCSPTATQDDNIRNEKIVVLQRLGKALPAMLSNLNTINKPSSTTVSKSQDKNAAQSQSKRVVSRAVLEERVAISEMAARVRAEVRAMGKQEKVIENDRIAKLPVPDDAHVKQGVKLATLYYRAIGVQ